MGRGRRPQPSDAPDPSVIAGLAGDIAGDVAGSTGGFTSEMFYGAFSPTEIPTTATERSQAAIEAVKAAEKHTDAQQRLTKILEDANIDPNNPITQSLLSAMAQGQQGEDAAKYLLSIFTGYGGASALNYMLEQNADIALIRSTPYTEALVANDFTTNLAPQQLGEMQQKAGMSGIPPSQFPTTAETGDYEYSQSTGAIRYKNGTIVTADNGIIYDPTASAPGSPQYLREAQGWDNAKIEEWKSKLVTYGYLSKDDAKGDGFTVQMRSALETYWRNYYVAGGKPISASTTPGGGAAQTPLIDYQDFSAQIQNDARDQLRRVLGVEPTELQVRQQTQYVMRTASDLQKKFRGKDYGSPGSMALTEATERAIGNIETSPYAQDVRENTSLHDALANAASVSRSLLT